MSGVLAVKCPDILEQRGREGARTGPCRVAETDCGQLPTCAMDPSHLEAEVLANQGLTQKPDCTLELEAPLH
jgi:hypothetical protein